ncbi:DUF1194 domain-containing protein [Poseidonocella pacifica]|uniref:DUF1194 domain-containing protein n=1 Tax=Poseidonocella pacifica TaxID=871651 RepID=UPI001FDFFC0D|nr:DUF1194 domain-containing protein [Poseidonocella pacifica]
MVRLAAALVCLAGAGEAAPCRLALALALDVSSSVDAEEYALQSRGLAAALNAGSVRGAILSEGEAVWLLVYEWSGPLRQHLVLDWTALTSGAEIDRVVAVLGGATRSRADLPTALGHALGFGATQLLRGPDCARRVLDVSGDGENNSGFRPSLAYRHFPFDGVTVNGLAIVTGEQDVTGYYWREVARGPGAFVETADGFEDYERAMTRKLFREIRGARLTSLESTWPG